MTAGDLRQGPLKQQPPGSESRDQRGPDKKYQLLDPEDCRQSESNSYREAPGTERREKETSDFVRTAIRSHRVGLGWEGRRSGSPTQSSPS